MIALLFALVASAGQIAYEHVPLNDLVERSDVIVKGKLDQPPSGTVMADVSPEDQPGACDPYAVPVHYVLVDGVLKDTIGLKSTEGKMTIRSGNASRLLDLHRRACLEGVRKSALFERHGERRDLEKGEDYLFFLSYKEGAFELTAAWAWAPARKSNKVRRLVRKQ